MKNWLDRCRVAGKASADTEVTQTSHTGRQTLRAWGTKEETWRKHCMGAGAKAQSVWLLRELEEGAQGAGLRPLSQGSWLAEEVQ